MPEEPGTLRRIAWLDVMPWLSVLPRGFRLAFSLRAITLAVCGIVLTAVGCNLFGRVLSGSEDPTLQKWIHDDQVWPWQQGTMYPGQRALPANIGEFDPFQNPFFRVWRGMQRPFTRFFFEPVEEPTASSLRIQDRTETESFSRTEVRHQTASVARYAYLILCGLWSLAVWSLFGGAIARSAALGFTREDRLALRPALAYSAKRWGSYFSAPLLPLGGILALAIPMCLVGLLLRFDVGVVVAAILWPLVLIGGLLMAILLIGLAFGWPLMWATISVERTDYFDALSRSYAYVYQRPLHYLFYSLVAGVIGMLGWLLVSLFAWTIVALSAWGVSWGSNWLNYLNVDAAARTADDLSALVIGGRIIAFWNGWLGMLVLAFLISYFWTAATAIYLLLRQQVDATELDDVATDEDDAVYGLPAVDTVPPGALPAASAPAPQVVPPAEDHPPSTAVS